MESKAVLLFFVGHVSFWLVDCDWTACVTYCE